MPQVCVNRSLLDFPAMAREKECELSACDKLFSAREFRDFPIKELAFVLLRYIACIRPDVPSNFAYEWLDPGVIFGRFFGRLEPR
jgi:hypothetical protein